MKFRHKVLLLCILVYAISIISLGIIVPKNNYDNLLSKEIHRSLAEEDTIYNNIRFYLYVNEKQSEKKIMLSDYSEALVDIFGDEKKGIEIFDNDRKLLASNSKTAVGSWNKDLEAIFSTNRNYVLRRSENKHLLYINHKIQFNNETSLISYIKDISHVDEIKHEQRIFFIKTGFIGFLFITIIIMIISRILIKPVEILSETSQKIADGNYNCRVNVTGNDEIALLANHFNKMAEQIEHKISELKVRDESKQRFIDNLTHELRTPLTSIMGYTELLMSIKYDEKKFYKGLNYINSEGERLLKMSQILMSMILIRKDSLQLKEENLIKVLNETVEIMKIRGDKKNLHIDIHGEACTAAIDKDMIKLVLTNLIDNAMKVSPDGGTIILGVENHNEKKCVFVKDNGRGMKEEHIKKVLEPFYRVDKSRSRKEGGAGLGLSLCNEIIKRHNGEIIIESKLREGTSVKIYL